MKFLTTWSGSDGMSVCGNNPPKKSQICSFSLLSKYLSNFDKFWWFYAYFHWFRTRFRMKILIFSLFSWKNTSKTCLWCFKMHDIIIIFYYEKNENFAFVVKIAILRQGFIACIDDFVEIIGGNLQYRSRACATGRKNKENHWYTREKAVASSVFFDMFEKIEIFFREKNIFFVKKRDTHSLTGLEGRGGDRGGCAAAAAAAAAALLFWKRGIRWSLWCDAQFSHFRAVRFEVANSRRKCEISYSFFAHMCTGDAAVNSRFFKIVIAVDTAENG